MLAFVQYSPVAYDLNADDIQELENANVSATVIVAMLEHGKQLRSNPVAVHADQQPAPADQQAPIVNVAVNAPPEGEANIDLFYEALSPYGTWAKDEDNGWVWEPTDGVRDANWSPYANDGHWIWSDYGWYWESSTPYGWAAYHYGRWSRNSHNRWCWAPDNVWGPAWVDWRHSDENIGWAPLPFGSRFEVGVGFSYRGKNVGFDFHLGMDERAYSFVPSHNFLDVNLGVVLVPENRRHNVYNQTTVINNTYVYNDNRIINNGVSTAVVSRATNRQIEKVSIVDAKIAAGQPIRGEQRSANTITAYRPKVANVAPIGPTVIVERQRAQAARATPIPAVKDPKSSARESVKPTNEQDARHILSEEKAKLGEPKKTVNEKPVAAPAVKPDAAAEAEAKQKAIEAKSEEKAKEKATNEAATKQHATAEAEAKQKVIEAKSEEKTREKATNDAEVKQHAAAEAEARQKAIEAKSEEKAHEKAANDTEVKQRPAAEAETKREEHAPAKPAAQPKATPPHEDKAESKEEKDREKKDGEDRK